MDINSIIEHAAATVREIPELGDIPVIEVHKGNVAFQLQQAVAKTYYAILVGWNGFKARSNSSKTIVGDTALIIEVFEKPVLAEKRPEFAPPLLDSARLIADAVNLSQPPGQSPIVFSEISPVVEPSPGIISTTVTFTVSNSTL